MSEKAGSMQNGHPARGLWTGVLCALAGIASAMSFVVDEAGYVGKSDPPASATSYLWCALALLFALFFWHVYKKRGLKLRALPLLFGLLFGVLNALGGLLFAYDSWAMLLNAAGLCTALLRAMGQALPMIAALTLLDGLLCSGALHGPGLLEQLPQERFARLRHFWRAHPLGACMLLFVLCWSPYLLAFFPGTVCWDLGEMVAQFFGQRPMDTWHPVFTTWLIGGCVWLGRLVGSDNLGAALFTLLQTVALSYALARAVAFLRAAHVNRALRLAAVLFFALTPLWGGYAQFISKDTLYTAALLLFTLCVLALLGARERGEAISSRLVAELGLWALLTCLLRSNGLYVVLPTALLVICFGARGALRVRVGGALAAALTAALLFSSVLLPALGIRNESASGLYSVCFQQSARVLRDHAQTVTPEEYAELDRVLDAERLPELYEPWISDPVKYTFKYYGQGAEVEKAALARFRGTWLSMLQKYPLSYAEAFFAGNLSYYTFMPKLEGETYNNQAGNRLVFETYALGEDARFLHTTQPAALQGARTALAMFARGWRHIPLFSLLYCCAAYTWVLVGAGIAVARQRRWRALIGFLPALLSLGVCMLGPVNDYFRYFLPIAAMTLPLLGYAARKSY
ncbi:MAG: DUF6020 family protein [Clostridia bacterium]